MKTRKKGKEKKPFPRKTFAAFGAKGSQGRIGPRGGKEGRGRGKKRGGKRRAGERRLPDEWRPLLPARGKVDLSNTRKKSNRTDLIGGNKGSGAMQPGKATKPLAGAAKKKKKGEKRKRGEKKKAPANPSTSSTLPQNFQHHPIGTQESAALGEKKKPAC